MHVIDDLITLTDAAKVAPGRPSTNCVWRWCRRGVLSRSGQRIRFNHVRVGGKLFTTAQWVGEFGKALAAADAEHFDSHDGSPDQSVVSTPSAVAHQPRTRRPRQYRSQHRETSLTQVNRELEAEGL